MGKDEKIKCVTFCRVSSSHADWAHQLTAIKKFCKARDYEIVCSFEEKISGGKRLAERKAITELMKYVDENPDIQKCVVYEFSRISRRICDALSLVEFLSERQISLVIVNNGIESLNEDGSVNAISQLILSIFAGYASLERSLIRERLYTGYKHHREVLHLPVGRKKDWRKDLSAYSSEYSKEIELLRKSVSLRNVRTITGTSINTLRRLKVLFGIS